MLGIKSTFFFFFPNCLEATVGEKDELHAYISSYLLIFVTFIVAFKFQSYLSKKKNAHT